MTFGIDHLIFVRHGESEHHTKGMTGGWTDTSLTEFGKQQIAATADCLQKMELTGNVGLYASDLKRTIESATIIGSLLGHSHLPLAELRELNNGDAAGLTRRQAEEISRPEPGQRDLDWRPYNNAESYREMAERLAVALRIIEAEERQKAIVVGHGLSGQALMQALLKLPLELEVSFRFDTASITELRVNQWGEREIVRLNTRCGA